MFSIRIDKGKSTRMISCASYDVDLVSGSEAVFSIVAQEGKPPQQVRICDGETAFVMNEQGNTVHRVTTRAEPAVLKTT